MILEVLVAEVALLVADCEPAFVMRKELIDHKAEAFQNRSLYGDAIACLYIFLLFDSLLCHVVASDFERIIAVLFL